MTYSVSQINSYIRNLMENDMILTSIRVSGELSNVKYHSSGHIYFTIKDSRSALSGVMFAGSAALLDFRMQEGQSVVVNGNIGVYERDGKYQIYARSVERTGAGILYEKFEKLKKELEEMGMFDQMYKQDIPRYIGTLGVVTAPTGAAVRDIINISRRRNPYIRIILFPAKVQGDGAAESIARGIEILDSMETDTIIIGRGGGSIEDLSAFNERIVAEAIFNCSTPVISGTGHETDFTIADFVADLRAPTPSAAAELAVFDYSLFRKDIEDYRNELLYAMNSSIKDRRSALRSLESSLLRLSPSNSLSLKRSGLEELRRLLKDRFERLLNDSMMRVSDMEDTLKYRMEERIKESRQRLAIDASRLDALSPLTQLSRGYTFTEAAGGRGLTDVATVSVGDELKIYVKNGKVYADVTRIEKNQNGK